MVSKLINMVKIKLLVFLLFVFSTSFGQSFDKLIDDKIQTAIKTIPQIKTDTIGVVKTVATSGVINIDTLVVGRNQGGWFELSLSGGKARAVIVCYISNTNGVNTVDLRNPAYPFTGLTGGKFEVVDPKTTNNNVVVRVTGTLAITDWKYTRYNK